MIDLEEQLYTYGAALDQLIDGHASAAQHRSSSRSAGRYAAVVLVAASIAASVAIVQSRDELPANGHASMPAPTATEGATTERPEADGSPVDSEGVVIDDQSWQANTPEGVTGPGYYQATGHAGADVVEITLELGNGTSSTATLDNGHFYGKVIADDGVALFQERVTWTLQDGTTRSSRADLLDTVTPAEQCAATPGCIDARLGELQSRATGVEAEVLADLIVTDVEYQAALQRVADCANEAGGNVTIIGLTIQVGGTTDQPTFDQCQATNLAVIGDARDLINARDRLAADQN